MRAYIGLDNITPIWIQKWFMGFLTSGTRIKFKLNRLGGRRTKNGVLCDEPLVGGASRKACV